MTAEARCAFARCQAGGVILAGAPRAVGPLGESYYGTDWYHPGCLVAMRKGAR